MQQLKVTSLQLRRTEKDFLIRKDPKYIEQHHSDYLQLQAQISVLRGLNEQIGGSIPVDDIAKLFADYREQFVQLTNAMQAKGLDKNSGRYGELRAATHKLEETFKASNNSENHISLLTVRRHEKDYMLRGDTSYLSKLDVELA